MVASEQPSSAAAPRAEGASVLHNLSEAHNPSVDEDAARRGACGQVHLPTGATCTLQHGHNGSCEFSPAGDVEAQLAKHKAADHW